MTTNVDAITGFPYQNFANGVSPIGTSSGFKNGAMGAGLVIALAFTGTTSGLASQLAPRVEPRAVERPILTFSSLGRGSQSSISTSQMEPIRSDMALSHADSVRWLHAESGLTWDQLGRLFGVSRRAVHFWASGGKLNATNVELVRRFTEVVRGLESDTPSERRNLLLTFGPDGKSIVEKFRAANLPNQLDIQGVPFSPYSILGSVHDRNV